MSVHGAMTEVHIHEDGMQALYAAADRRRNTTVVIGADQDKGVLLLDIDVQTGAYSGPDELISQLELVIEALRGVDPMEGTA